MKRLWALSISLLFPLLNVLGLSSSVLYTPLDSHKVKISKVTQMTPLYLEHSQTLHSNQADTMLSWHYSHMSHQSHYSHQSHQSHYSHYSGG